MYDLRTTLINLKLLSTVKPNDKVCTLEQEFNIHSPSNWRSVYRLYYGETRAHNLKCIEDCMNSAWTHCKNLRNQGAAKQPEIDRLLRSLEEAVSGLASLQETYSYDAAIHARLAILTENIRLCQDLSESGSPHLTREHKSSPSSSP